MSSALGQSAVDDDIKMSDSEFAELVKVIRTLTGINISESKRQMVLRRLKSRLKANGLHSYRDYTRMLGEGNEAELEQFTNAITTNLTSFLREKHHFDFLADTIIPDAVRAKQAGSRRIRIWSAGCSTGEEPYSLAMTLRESFPDLDRWDVKVLCTDLDTQVLQRGKTGIYGTDRFDKMPDAQRERWFDPVANTGDVFTQAGFSAKPELRSLLTFKQLNLMKRWPMQGPFDVIFCRNVIIYFDKPTQRVLIDRYAELLEPGGYLILGHSESLFNVSERFKLLGKTIYRKLR